MWFALLKNPLTKIIAEKTFGAISHKLQKDKIVREKELDAVSQISIEQIKQQEHSWKDEWLTVLFSVPLILAFCGEWGRQIVSDGFTALEAMPEYYQYTLGTIVAASFGMRGAAKFFGKK